MSDGSENKSLADYMLAIAGVLTPVVLVYLGHIYQDAEAKSGIHEKYVEMAMDILQKEPTENNLELRKWALEVFHRYSDVPVHDEARDHILEHGISISKDGD